MNVELFQESLELLKYGCCHQLTAEQQVLLQNSLIILQSENKFSQIFFWGCIRSTSANDYFIAFGYPQHDCLAERRFFWSSNCRNWFLLPRPNAEIRKLCLLAAEPFCGDISYVIKVVKDPTFAIEPATEIVQIDQTIEHLKEEDRLACVIEIITNESAILPRGALYKRIVDGNTCYNPLFHGLTESEASLQRNFQLYRKPLENWNTNLLKRTQYNYSVDFFDTLGIVEPKNKSFSLNLNNLDFGLVILKSLHWPGMTFFHKLRTQHHGFCYFGDAKKNLDLLFML